MHRTPHRILHDALPPEYYAVVMQETTPWAITAIYDSCNNTANLSPHIVLLQMFGWDASQHGFIFWETVYDWLNPQVACNVLPSL